MGELYVIFFIIVVVVVGVMQYLGHGISYGDPRLLWLAIPLLILSTIGLWKDKRELVKRCFLALPFALLIAVLAKVSGLKMFVSCLSGLLLFYALVIEVKSIKTHYIITLITALALFLCALAFKNYVTSPWTSYIACGCGFAVLVFYQSYTNKLERSQKIPALWPIAIASVKFTVACAASVILLIISHILCRRYNLGFVISFTISVLIAISFLVICETVA